MMGLKMENLTQFHMICKLLFDPLTVMNAKIVQNQKNLTTAILLQASHELDLKLGVHGILIHHELHLFFVGDSRHRAEMALIATNRTTGDCPLGANPLTRLASV
jgi:hypothetical protein